MQPWGKLYVAVRTDIQKRWWAPQACHAAMQFCLDHKDKLPHMGWSHTNKEPGTLVILDGRNQDVILELAMAGDPVSVYFEPFLNSHTAVAFICDGSTPFKKYTKGLDLLKI